MSGEEKRAEQSGLARRMRGAKEEAVIISWNE